MPPMPPTIDPNAPLVDENEKSEVMESLEPLTPKEPVIDTTKGNVPAKKKARTMEDPVPEPEFTKPEYIPLTTHSDAFGVDPVPISWGHPDPSVRGPVICTVRHSSQRNAIGAHQGVRGRKLVVLVGCCLLPFATACCCWMSQIF